MNHTITLRKLHEKIFKLAYRIIAYRVYVYFYLSNTHRGAQY